MKTRISQKIKELESLGLNVKIELFDVECYEVSTSTHTKEFTYEQMIDNSAESLASVIANGRKKGSVCDLSDLFN